MTTALERLHILEQAEQVNNVQQTCKAYGISRTLFYRWKRRYEAFGPEGLEDQIAKKPNMPNQVNGLTEKTILDQVLKTPKDGPRQLCYTLSHKGVLVGETGVYKVLKRHNLNKRAARLNFAQSQAHQKSDWRQLSKLDLKLKQPEHQRPGYLAMETLRAWHPSNGQCELYFYALFEAHSKWGLIKLFPDKASINLNEVYLLKVAPLIKTFKLPLTNMLSEQQPPFHEDWEKRFPANKSGQPANLIHKFWRLPSGKEDAIGPMNTFISTILDAVHQALILKEQPVCFKELEALLDKCLKAYNFKQPQSGQTPSDIIMAHIENSGIAPETLPLWVHLRMV